MWPWRSNAVRSCCNNLPTPLHSRKGRAVHNLGETRSSQKENHLLLTADTFVRTALPGMKACTAFVHAVPAIAAQFTQYTADFELGGALCETLAQRIMQLYA